MAGSASSIEVVMPSADKPGREQVESLRRLLGVSALLTEQDDRAEILKAVACSVAAIAGEAAWAWSQRI